MSSPVTHISSDRAEEVATDRLAVGNPVGLIVGDRVVSFDVGCEVIVGWRVTVGLKDVVGLGEIVGSLVG